MDPNKPSTSKNSEYNKKSYWQGRNRGWQPYRRGGCNNSGPRVKPTTMPLPNINMNAVALMNSNSITVSSVEQPIIAFRVESVPEQYPGWKLYFPQEVYKKASQIDIKVKAMKKHISDNISLYNLREIKRYLWFPLLVQKLLDDNNFKQQWPNFSQDLIENPMETLNSAGLAMHQMLLKLPEVCASQLSQPSTNNSLYLQCVRARIEGYGPVVNLRSLKVSSYGRLISVRGTIIRASASQILCSWMAFRCSNCSAEQAIKQLDGIMTVPSSCQSTCRSRSNFIPLLSSPFTRTETFQIIRLQESMQGAQFDLGRVPRSIEIELSQDLVDSVCPGDDITVTGILKVRPQDECQRKGQASMYKMYLQGVAVASNKNVISSRKSDFTEKDLEAIDTIKAEPCPFRLLVHSLCPSIYGHDMIKAGLILGLFGGSGNNNGRRSEAHVLVVGDPGVGKSQMLQACSNVSPRGIFVCGNSSSNAGLTVSVRHEKGTGGSLEAGALVLADQGACCIDEFDKMGGNHQALLEVMEQQTVSVAKAGVLCSLPARTCVLAAANPSGGHYDKSKTVSENLKMNPALLSRFDLVFILLDRPDAHLDSLLTAHIQALHSGGKKVNISSNTFESNQSKNEINKEQNTMPLSKRLKLLTNESIDILPHILMQKYITFARKNIHPKLSSEAADELKKFYLDLRKVQHGVDSIPVTTRQLEALVRLTQARARIDLSTEASLKHAEDVLAIVKYSLVDVFSTDEGTLQMRRNINGSGMSQSTQIKKFLRMLQMKSTSLNQTVFTTDELKDILTHGGLQGNFTQLIDSMNIQGFLLKKGRNMYKFLID